jgi:hypothetical protein
MVDNRQPNIDDVFADESLRCGNARKNTKEYETRI